LAGFQVIIDGRFWVFTKGGIFRGHELIQLANGAFETLVRHLAAPGILGAGKGQMSKYNVQEEIRFPLVTVALCLGVSHGAHFGDYVHPGSRKILGPFSHY
jgi:hypothetical protein